MNRYSDGKRNRKHVQPVILHFAIGKVARRENPEFSSIFADEFAGDAGIIKALRLKFLGVKENPRAPWRG